MKKLLTLTLSLLAVVACFLISGCDKSPITADENTVFITATDKSFDFTDKTVLNFMEYLKDKGEFDFEISDDGMVTSINGKANTNNSYWMLYTDDDENANEQWGTFEHEGKIYGSATAGVKTLKIKENCLYIWAYQTF